MTDTDNFSALGLSDEMLAAVRAKGFETPTSIQTLTIPRLLDRSNDLIAQSQTGTGKTAAYGLPILQTLQPAHGPVQAIVLVPTRELALQAAEELISYNAERRLSITAIYGGAAMSEQLRRLKKGVDIVVGTPGRVLDHIRRGTLQLDQVRFLVLDEADEMLNMGFVEDVEEIMSHTGDERRVLLFSATMPQRIVRLSENYMRDTEIVRVESKQITADLTEQIYFEVREADKFDALTRIIDIEPDFYGIVFVRTKIGVDEIVGRLLAHGYAAEALHGDVSQAQREKILRKFKERSANILVATDVAARGIDIGNLSHVINYSLPQDSESYVHRIGRTGRAGNMGTAITFISPSEFRKFNFLMRDIKVDIKKETLPSPQDIVEMKRLKIKEDLREIVENESPATYTEFAAELLEQYGPEEALSALLQLAFRSELDQSNYPEIRSFSVDRKGTARLFIGVGRRDGYTARKLAEMLKAKCGMRDKHIDDIHIGEDFSFVSVPFRDAEEIVSQLNRFNRGRRPLAKIANPDREGAPERPRRAKSSPAPGAPAQRKAAPATPREEERSAREESSERASAAVEKTRKKLKSKLKPEFPDFSKMGNEGFDWSAFQQYDEAEKWGRNAEGRATKSVRKTPKAPTTAARRIAKKQGRK
ncbi:DEAD/DEAH box helicase [Alistipes sp.]|uniref:DEAD/DEAH box helicase n=1 Tax=Alistipes sp. TaxID=1872444 RepID=UPI003AEF5B0E